MSAFCFYGTIWLLIWGFSIYKTCNHYFKARCVVFYVKFLGNACPMHDFKLWTELRGNCFLSNNVRSIWRFYKIYLDIFYISFNYSKKVIWKACNWICVNSLCHIFMVHWLFKYLGYLRYEEVKFSPKIHPW